MVTPAVVASALAVVVACLCGAGAWRHERGKHEETADLLNQVVDHANEQTERANLLTYEVAVWRSAGMGTRTDRQGDGTLDIRA